MEEWRSLAEEAIRKAMEEGRLDELPGAGKPLKLDDDPNVPESLRAAYKILRDNDLEPEWMMLKRDIDRQKSALRDNIARGWRAYKGALNDAGRDKNPDRAAERRLRAESAWALATRRYGEAAETINRMIRSYNLKVPNGIPHLAHVDAAREVQRVEAG